MLPTRLDASCATEASAEGTAHREGYNLLDRFFTQTCTGEGSLDTVALVPTETADQRVLSAIMAWCHRGVVVGHSMRDGFRWSQSVHVWKRI